MYSALLMSSGLTFGAIAALYGLSHGIIDKGQYSVLATPSSRPALFRP